MSLDAWKYRNTKPQSAATILANTFKRSRITDKLRRYEFFLSWADIVGREIAEVSFPEKMIKDRILIVRVIDSVWAHQLAMNKFELLKKLTEFDPTITLEDIRFVSGSPKDFKKTGSSR